MTGVRAASAAIIAAVSATTGVLTHAPPADAERLTVPARIGSKLGILHITTLMGNGLFAGQYESYSFGCQGFYSASGRVSLDRVVFTVHFAKCGTLVTWKGTVRQSQLFARWQMVFTDAATGRRRILGGKDTLGPQP
jgi:hypothetical protein